MRMIGWGRLQDVRDEHQGSSRELRDKAEETDEVEEEAECKEGGRII